MEFLLAGLVMMPTPNVDGWLAEKLDPAPFVWMQDIPMFDGKAAPADHSAGSWLETVAAPSADPSFVVHRVLTGGVEFLGLIEGERLEEWHQDLANVLLSAGLHGAVGEVAIFSAEAGVCFHILVGKRGRVMLPDQEAFAGLFSRQQQKFVQLQQLAATRARVDGLDIRAYLDRMG